MTRTVAILVTLVTLAACATGGQYGGVADTSFGSSDY